MKSFRGKRSLQDGLSPWQSKQSEDDDCEMNDFCNKILPKLKPQKNICEKINEQFN